MRTHFAALTLLAVLPNVGVAAVLHVPDPYPTIQAALDVASSGDQVVLSPGEYSGDGNTRLLVENLDLTIHAESGPLATRIVGDGPDGEIWGLSVRPGSGHVVTLSGVGFEALAGANGSAITASGYGQIVVRGCRFVECESPASDNSVPYAGAVRIAGAIDAEVSGCEFLFNRDSTAGGAIGVQSPGQVRVEDCVFEANAGGALWLSQTAGSVAVARCHFSNNGVGFGVIYGSAGSRFELYDSTVVSNAGAISVGGSAVVARTTITRNASTAGPGAGIRVWSSGQLILEESIVRGNCALEGFGDIDAFGPITITCCALDSSGIRGWDHLTLSGEQVWNDPLFCDPEGLCGWANDGGRERYQLDANSPCAAWRSPCGSTMGALEVACGAETLGGCCLGSECIIAPASECAELGGEYLGDDSSCEPGSCDPTPVLPTGWGALKARFR